MIQQELQQLSTTPRDLRKFGLLVGGVLVVLGSFFLWSPEKVSKPWHTPAAPYFLIPGGLLVLFGLVAPRALKAVYVAWMAMAFTLGLIMSTLVLSICFFLVITPLSLLGRMCGKDFLFERLNRQAKTYWLPREHPGPRPPAEYERQF